MVNFLDRIYTGIEDSNSFLTRLKIYSIQRLLIRIASNLFIPFLYQFGKKKHSLNQEEKAVKYIVSLTSFPNRIGSVWIVVESILRQSYKVDKIILWLSKEQFDSLDVLPQKLLAQQKRGLEIRLVDGDIKSHKKYFYALKQYPNDFLITVDDDIIYPTTLVSELIDVNKSYPQSICCHRGHSIKIENGKVMPYAFWKIIKKFGSDKYDIFFTSGGGTLFPPNSLHQEVLNENVFKKYCFNADDVWLNFMSRLNSTNIVKTNYYSDLLPILNSKNLNLHDLNLGLGENDSQLAAVRNFYFEKFGIDFFTATEENKSIL
jgi:hypothetical protein